MPPDERDPSAIESPSQVITDVGDEIVVDDQQTYGTEGFQPATEHKEVREK